MLRATLTMHRIVFAVIASLLFACGGSPKKSTQPRLTETAPDPDRDRRQPRQNEQNKGDVTVSTDTGDDLSWLNPVYFEFDSSDLTPTARDTLARLPGWMAAHPKAALAIEGHCDEQGTDEYNIALGQRRAQVIADYLARLGTDAKRLNPTSYGALRPAVEGHDEVAWSKNRRGEFRVGP